MARSSTKPTTRSGRRRYDASRRREQARESGRRIADAAGRLFTEQGYGATSLDEVAAAAGVSTPTVYAKFGSKAGLLKVLVDVAVAGDDEDVALAERTQFQEMLTIEPLTARIRAMCELAAAIHERSAPVLRLVTRVAGSDPAVADLLVDLERQMRESTAMQVDAFPASARRDGLGRDEAVELVVLFGHPEGWNRLVHDAGWTGEQYVDWLERTIRRMVLDLEDR